MAVTRVLGGFSGLVFRFLAYLFLRWIPGRHGAFAIPAAFALNALTLLYNKASSPKPPPPAVAALVPQETTAPSFADVAAAKSLPPVVDTPPSTPNGSLKRRKKKSMANLAAAQNAYTAAQASGDDSEASSVATTTSSSSTALTKRKLHRAPRSTTKLRHLITSIAFGAPSPSRFLNRIAFFINLLLLSAVLDAVWTPIIAMNETDLAFARVGAVDHHSVKISARIPPERLLSPHGLVENNNTSIEGLLPVDEFIGAKVVYRPTKPLGKWIPGGDLIVSEDNDWTGLLRLDDLWASTEYEYRLLRPSGVLAHHPAFPSSRTFTTFPDPALSTSSSPGSGTHFTFASTSCVKAGFPYKGPWGHRTVKGASHLLETAQKEAVNFVLFLGDLIYADVPYYPGHSVSSYYKRYRQIFSSPEMLKLAEKIPLLAIYDDHEIANDFSHSEFDPRFPPANKAWVDYVGSVNPDPAVPGQNYFEFQHGDAAFFVWDVRRFRSPNEAEDNEDKIMLGEKQKQVFFDWAARVNNTVTWKFVVSSVPLMTLWSHGGEDTWAGFTTERDAILDVLEFVPNVIVLSGDRHEFAAASIRNTVTEFSTSPLSMFYLPVRTLSQNNGRGAIGEDILLNYLPDGNSKFTTFEVDTRVANQPVVRVKVFIDGEEAWKLDVKGKPLDQPLIVEAIGSLGKGLRELLELLGFKKRSWF